ncbi:MAG: cytochrome c biogenesis protein CcsA, partial [bacterium]
LEMRLKVRGTGMFMFGVALLFQLASWRATFIAPEANKLLKNPIFGVHVILAIIGYTGFVVSALYGVFFLILYRVLKSKRFGLFFNKLPPLELLSGMNIHAAVVGLTSLTASIVVGVMLSHVLDVPILSDAKFIQTVVAWGLYCALVAGYYLKGWRGHRQIYFSLGSFTLLILSTAIVAHMFDTFHKFN